MTALLLVMVAAVAMEPLAALLHRFVMHGSAWGWHQSHHAARRGGFERNDLFPVVLAASTIAIMWIGNILPGWRPLLWIGAGVTAYGFAYLVVHDLCIHRRVPRLVIAGRYVAWVRRAHRVHHLYGRAPYGFLLPVVPAELRARARGARGEGDGRRNATATVPTLRGVDTRARREKTS